MTELPHWELRHPMEAHENAFVIVCVCVGGGVTHGLLILTRIRTYQL
jgi:hypothetical protein